MSGVRVPQCPLDRCLSFAHDHRRKSHFLPFFQGIVAILSRRETVCGCSETVPFAAPKCVSAAPGAAPRGLVVDALDARRLDRPLERLGGRHGVVPRRDRRGVAEPSTDVRRREPRQQFRLSTRPQLVEQLRPGSDSRSPQDLREPLPQVDRSRSAAGEDRIGQRRRDPRLDECLSRSLSVACCGT